MLQLQAGYLVGAVGQALRDWAKEDPDVRQHELNGLLEWLGTFDVVTTLDLMPALGASHPLLAVAANLLGRGLPTLPSVWLEQQLAQQLGLTRRQDQPEDGSIGFPFTRPLTGEAVWQALHPATPAPGPWATYYDTNSLDSDFERAFVHTYLGDHPLLPQLLQSQRPLDSLVKAPTHGRVDFSLEIPYHQAHQRIDAFLKTRTLRRRKSLVAEIDGKAYHQYHIDLARDFAIHKMGHAVTRVTEEETLEGVETFLQRVYQEPFVQRCQGNFADPAYLDSPLTQLVWQPWAIARIQRVVLRYLLSQTWQQAQQAAQPQLRVAILERDIAAGELALADLQRTLQRLAALAQDELTPLPQLSWTCYRRLDDIRVADYDLVIDHSVLRRTGIFVEDCHDRERHPLLVQLRTAHYVDDRTYTPVLSAPPIRYRDLVQALENEQYAPHPAPVEGATAFLQDLFRKQAFRDGQLPILNRAFQGNSVIGLLPTGGGKSLTYQLAALLQPGLTIVVDPIRSLMVDQDRGLRKVWIDKTAYLNSSLSATEKRYLQQEVLLRGELQFVFVSPERFVIDEFRQMLSASGHQGHMVAYLVIDEAHCVSEWGHDFRIPYLNLGVNAQTFCPTWHKTPVPLFGLTATASFDVLADIERELQIEQGDGHAIVRYENTVRDEINYLVVAAPTPPPTEGMVYTEWAAKASVGGTKQETIFELIHKKEHLLAPYNEEEAIRQTTTRTVESYLGVSSLGELQARAEAAGLTAEELYYQEKRSRLHIPDLRAAFGQRGNLYNYGVVVFTPHRTRWLGILGKNGMFHHPDHTELVHLPPHLPIAKLPASGDTMGFFMGSSDEDLGVAAELEAHSYAHMDRFLAGQNSVMLATKAFGMGIDKSNIRHTIHLNLPSSIESYVQEAGRAGRDGKLALSTIVFDDTLFPTADGPYHVDADVLHYFHARSFKGQLKERAMLYELRNKLELPAGMLVAMPRGKVLCQQLNLAFPGYTGWKLKVWEGALHRRLYLNVDQFTEGSYLDLTHIGIFHTPHLPTAVIKRLQHMLAGAPLSDNAALEAWLAEPITMGADTQGIERQLQDMQLGETRELVVYFTNLYYSPETSMADFALNPRHLDIVQQQASHLGYPELLANLPGQLREAVYNQDPLEVFLTRVGLDPGAVAQLSDPNATSREIQRLQRAYYAGRNKADTDKAIYRLTCLGIIDTYTIDYHYKFYRLQFTKHPDQQYFDNLAAFVARYTSARQAEAMVGQLRETSADAIAQGQATALSVCLSFLTGFIYDNIRLKRQRAIEDMLALCRNSLKVSQESGVIAQNLFIKDEIYYYFNAKYSRPALRELVDGEEEEVSLLDDVQSGEWDVRALVDKYLRVVEGNGAGEFINHIKHLRGSTMRLLRAYPQEPALLLLKSYTLFILGNLLPSLRPEARNELIAGLVQWRRREGEVDVEAWTNEVFQHRLQRHVDYHRELVQEALAVYAIEYHAAWLRDFNHKLLANYA